MTGIKKSDEQPPAERSHTKKAPHRPLTATSREKGFWREAFISVVIHYVVPPLLGGASVAWLYFARDPSVPQWPFLIFVALTVVLVYLSLISLQFFFRKDFTLSRRKSLHLALLAILVVTVTAPLAMVLSYINSRTANERRLIRLYNQVTRPMTKVLQKESIDNDDFQDLLNSCTVSIALSKPQAYELRATVVYLDKTGRYLIVPKKGYYGVGFDEKMEHLYFNVSAMQTGETDGDFRKRVGVAGRSFLDRKEITDENVQIPTPGKGYSYKPYQGSSQDLPDAAMICVPIPDLKGGKADSFVGVLSISSPTPGVFKENDVAVARFYATLLGKYKTPLETPQFVLEEEERKRGK